MCFVNIVYLDIEVRAECKVVVYLDAGRNMMPGTHGTNSSLNEHSARCKLLLPGHGLEGYHHRESAVADMSRRNAERRPR